MATVAELVAQAAKAVYCEAEFIEDIWVIDPQLWEQRVAQLTASMLEGIETFLWGCYVTMAPEGQAEEWKREIAQVRQQAGDLPGARIEHMQRLFEQHLSEWEAFTRQHLPDWDAFTCQHVPDWKAFTRQYLAEGRELWVKIARGLA